MPYGVCAALGLLGLLLATLHSAASATLHLAASLGENEWQVMREQVFPAFEAREHCRIRAVNVEAEHMLKKIEAMHRARRMHIDLLLLDTLQLAPYVAKRLVLDLTPYQDLIEPAVYPALVRPLIFAGRLMFFPGRPNVQITYYNTDVFHDKTFPPPRTWEALLAVAKRLQAVYKVGKVAIHGTLDSNTTTQVFEFITAAGGKITTLNDAGSVQAFTFLQALYPYLSPETKKANWNTTNKLLSEESLFLARNWPLGMQVIVQQNQKKNIKAYATWAGPAGPATMIGGDVIALTRRSPHQELGLKFARYFMSREIQTLLVTQLGWPPIRADALGSVPAWQQGFSQAITEAMTYGHYRPAILGWSAVEKYVNLAFQAIVIDGADVQATLDTYARELQAELAWFQ
ncbi:MAG: extracellular solute-binding protein [Candidatus Tectimicrobiota bacterium]